MAFTYDITLSSSLSQVRFRIGDVEVARPEFQDETINALLATGLTVLGASVQLVRGLVGKYARYADVTIDDQLTRFKHIYDNYVSLLATLEGELAAENNNKAGALGGYSGILVQGVGDCDGPLDDPCACTPRWLL